MKDKKECSLIIPKWIGQGRRQVPHFIRFHARGTFSRNLKYRTKKKIMKTFMIFRKNHMRLIVGLFDLTTYNQNFSVYNFWRDKNRYVEVHLVGPFFFEVNFGEKNFNVASGPKSKNWPGRKLCMKYYLCLHSKHPYNLYMWRKQDLKYGVR